MSTYKVKVNNREISVVLGKTPMLDGQPFEADTLEYQKGRFHILHNNKSYTAEVLDQAPADRSIRIRVNNTDYNLTVLDRYDELLQAMGMDAVGRKGADNVKAPMPGLVLKVMIEPGQSIQKGDALVVLEAMKMENILKATSDGVVKKILVHTGDKVEKNQVMISLV